MTLGTVLRQTIQENGKNVEDIDLITVNGIGLNLNDFWNSADQCTATIDELKDEFKIVFKDNTWINKHYSRNGNVRFKYYKYPDRPVCILLNPSPQEYID